MVRTLVSGIKSLVAIVRYAGVVMRGWVRGPEWISPARPQNYGGRVQGGEDGDAQRGYYGCMYRLYIDDRGMTDSVCSHEI